MDIAILIKFFMWCAILNAGLLALSILVAFRLGNDFVYNLHSKWFPMPRETFNAALYLLIGLYKILVLVFNLVPWVVLLIIQ